MFPYLAPLLALVIWKHDRAHAVIFALVALSVTAALHAAFFFQSEFYHPFHLFSRAQNNLVPVAATTILFGLGRTSGL